MVIWVTLQEFLNHMLVQFWKRLPKPLGLGNDHGWAQGRTKTIQKQFNNAWKLLFLSSWKR